MRLKRFLNEKETIILQDQILKTESRQKVHLLSVNLLSSV